MSPRSPENTEMNEPRCYGCEFLADAFGNYVECKKSAGNGTHIFVDWYYWNDGSPDVCPLKTMNSETNDNT